MAAQELNEILMEELLGKAAENERKRYAYDLRNTPEDQSQRIINALIPGTEVPIHRHEASSETTLCLKGSVDVVFYRQLDNGGYEEIERVSLDPISGRYGVQIPKGAWHTIEVKEESTIFEGKDGAYKP